MASLSLEEAAHRTYFRTHVYQQNDQLVARTQAFIDAASVLFPDSTPINRAVGNWIPILQADVNTEFTDAHMPLSLWNQYVEHIYRMCLACSALENIGLITGPQALGLLAAWNAQFDP
jgi:hypothetical protein